MTILEPLPLKIIRQFIKTVWQNRHYNAIAEFFKPTAIIHSPLFSIPQMGTSAFQTIVSTWHTHLPDLKTCSELIFYDQAQNTVITQFTCAGQYHGPIESDIYFDGLPDQIIEYTGAGFYQFCNNNLSQITRYSSIIHWPKPSRVYDLLLPSKCLQKILDYPELTTQEIKCLALWLRNQSYQKIAYYLGNISKLTVKKHLENIRLKLFISNKSELFNLLQKTGLLINYLKFGEQLIAR